MENDNMKGHWTGIFRSDGGRTEIEFTEEVTAKKVIMKHCFDKRLENL